MFIQSLSFFHNEYVLDPGTFFRAEWRKRRAEDGKVEKHTDTGAQCAAM